MLTMTQACQRAGVTPATLRLYERRGLIAAVRDPINRRTYRRSTLRRLAVIKAAQAVGLSLAEIADALEAYPPDHPIATDGWHELSTSWRDELNLRIRALEQLRDGLEGCIGCGCLSMPTCPIYNPDDQLAEQGPGPRILDAVTTLEQHAPPPSVTNP